MPELAGVRVVVTRAVHQAEELAVPLRERGAQVILLPVIDIAPPEDSAPLREAAAQSDAYDWIVFTSANAVAAFAAELPLPRAACAAKVAAIGPATHDAAERSGFTVSVRPEKYVAEALVAALTGSPGGQDLAGMRVLLPSAAVTRDIVPRALREKGALVDAVEAYRNVIPSGAAELAGEIFQPPLPDWVTFASSSAVHHLVELVGVDLLRKIKIASIGPITSGSVRHHGLDVAVEASRHTTEGLIDALCKAH